MLPNKHNWIIASSSLSVKYLVLFVAFSVWKGWSLDFFKIGSQAQLSLHALHLCSCFLSVSAVYFQQRSGKIWIFSCFLFHEGTQWLMLILQENHRQTIKKGIIAIKPIMLSPLTHRNVAMAPYAFTFLSIMMHFVMFLELRPSKARKYDIGTAWMMNAVPTL